MGKYKSLNSQNHMHESQTIIIDSKPETTNPPVGSVSQKTKQMFPKLKKQEFLLFFIKSYFQLTQISTYLLFADGSESDGTSAEPPKVSEEEIKSP